jgi:hypothetical protein
MTSLKPAIQQAKPFKLQNFRKKVKDVHMKILPFGLAWNFWHNG